LVGTPSAGSVDSFRQLVEGKSFGPLWLPFAPPTVLGSMPSIYQLLPRVRHRPVVDEDGETIDHLDAGVWIDRRLGLADPDQLDEIGWLVGDKTPAEKKAIAHDHLRKCLALAKQFHQAIDLPATRPTGLDIHLFVGDAEETAMRVTLDADGNVETSAEAPGDGTVLRSSALMDERVGKTFGNQKPPLQSPIDFSSVFFLF
jgi:hypothetical protein